MAGRRLGLRITGLREAEGREREPVGKRRRRGWEDYTVPKVLKAVGLRCY